MLVIAHAHVAEWKAAQARDRALDRLSAVLTRSVELAGPRNWRQLQRAERRALVAYREALESHEHARARHSKWSRAYTRARDGAPFIVWTGGAS